MELACWFTTGAYGYLHVDAGGRDGAAFAQNHFCEEARPRASACHSVEAEALEAIVADKTLTAQVPRHVPVERNVAQVACKAWRADDGKATACVNNCRRWDKYC